MKSSMLFMAMFWLLPSSPAPIVPIHARHLPLAGDSGNQPYQVLDDWHMRKLKDGIQISTRWILTSQSIKTRQIKGTITIKAKKDEITKLITNEALAKEWMVFLDELQYFQIDGNPREWYSYGRINILGKLASYDVVTDNRLLPENVDKQTVITMNGAPGYLPDKSGVHRITGLYTSWNFTSLGKNQTRVDYILYTDMKPVIPAWMTEPVISAMMISTMNHFRKQALSGNQ